MCSYDHTVDAAVGEVEALHCLVIVLCFSPFAAAVALVEGVRVPAAAVNEDRQYQLVLVQGVGKIVEKLHVGGRQG